MTLWSSSGWRQGRRPPSRRSMTVTDGDLRRRLSTDIGPRDRRGSRAGDIPHPVEPRGDLRSRDRVARRVAARDRAQPGDRPASGGRSPAEPHRPAPRRPAPTRTRRRRSSGWRRAGRSSPARARPPARRTRSRPVGLRDAIREAVAAMPEDERTVILLAYQDELSQAEIAARLGWPLGTVKTRTRRALQRLRSRPRRRVRPRRRCHDAGARRRRSIRTRWTTTPRANSSTWPRPSRAASSG